VRVEARHLSADLAAQLPPSPSQSVETRSSATRAKQDEGDEGHERARIVAALTAHRWRPNAAAAALGISRATLYRRVAKLGIVGPHRS
jgi:sigma-54 dependent transcriptional regulator, acetoin dehydrogenase operon transcriptional activator AcoR